MRPSRSSTGPRGARRRRVALSAPFHRSARRGAPGRAATAPCPCPGAGRSVRSRRGSTAGRDARRASPTGGLPRSMARARVARARAGAPSHRRERAAQGRAAGTRATLATSVEPAALGANLGRSIDRAIARARVGGAVEQGWTLSGCCRRSRHWRRVRRGRGRTVGFVKFRSTRSRCPSRPAADPVRRPCHPPTMAGYLIARLLGVHAAGSVGDGLGGSPERCGRALPGRPRVVIRGLDRLETARRDSGPPPGSRRGLRDPANLVAEAAPRSLSLAGLQHLTSIPAPWPRAPPRTVPPARAVPRPDAPEAGGLERAPMDRDRDARPTAIAARARSPDRDDRVPGAGPAAAGSSATSTAGEVVIDEKNGCPRRSRSRSTPR